MLQYIETYEGTGSKQNKAKKVHQFWKNLILRIKFNREIHSLKYELVSPWHHAISWLP